MLSRKEFLASVLDRLKLLDLVNISRKSELVIINYHRVYNNTLKTDFDAGVFGPSAEMFEKQMLWLKSNTDILSENDIIDYINNGKKLPNRCSAVTFDDGYIDNYEIAYPILKHHKIPAMFFVPTKALLDRNLCWWDLINYLIKKCDKKSINIIGVEFQIDTLNGKLNAISEIIKYKKYQKEEKTFSLLPDLSEACGVDFPDIELQSAQLMTWENLIELGKNNVAIGSHTHSHRVLSTISASEQLNEMVKSMQVLQDKLGSKPRSIAYPVGDYNAFTADSELAAEKAGYEVAFSFQTGINVQIINDKYDIKRVDMSTNFSFFKARCLMPGFF
jgi:peptidoglycan/xylan/chitin deacetylase (PgdA/CDA1 family)